MDKEFLQKLRATLESMDARIMAVEHLVNDVVIDGLKGAAEEFEDNEKYSQFVDSYQGDYKPYYEAAKALFGDDFDLSDALYEITKADEKGEDYDEKARVSELLGEIQAKIDALTKSKVVEKTPDDIAAEFIAAAR